MRRLELGQEPEVGMPRFERILGNSPALTSQRDELSAEVDNTGAGNALSVSRRVVVLDDPLDATTEPGYLVERQELRA